MGAAGGGHQRGWASCATLGGARLWEGRRRGRVSGAPSTGEADSGPCHVSQPALQVGSHRQVPPLLMGSGGGGRRQERRPWPRGLRGEGRCRWGLAVPPPGEGTGLKLDDFGENPQVGKPRGVGGADLI